MEAAFRWARLVADAVSDASEALDHGQDPAPVLASRICGGLHADGWSYGQFDLRIGHGHCTMWPPAFEHPELIAATITMPHAHPVLHHWLTGNNDPTVVSTLITDQRRWRNSEAFDLLTRTIGCTESGGIRLDRGTETLHMIGFTRHSDFTAEEVELLRVMQRPALALIRHTHWLNGRSSEGAPWSQASDVGLTSRQLQVLELLAEGLLAGTIAHRLAVSPRTVHRHLGHIYAALGTHDRLTTVIRAQQLGLLPRGDVSPDTCPTALMNVPVRDRSSSNHVRAAPRPAT